jgi:hypothetical protein
MAKLMRRSFPQKRVIRRQAGSPVRTYAVCITATITENPRVSGTKMKW